MMEQIVLLSFAQVVANWKLLESHLTWPRFEEDYTVEWLQGQIAEGHIQVWSLGRGELVVLTQVSVLPSGKRVLEIIWAQGRGVEKYLSLGFETFVQFARFAGCKRIDARGRGGWTRVLRKIPGIRTEHILSVEVPDDAPKGH